MGLRNLFHKPLHFEYALLAHSLCRLLRLYALCRQLCLVKKELAGEKKVVTTLAKKDDENYKKTLALLKPYLTSAAYQKTLEYSRDKLRLEMTFELVHLALSVPFCFNNTLLKFWHLSGELLRHKCHYSQVLVYFALRLGFSFLFRLPFRYYTAYRLEKKHGFKTKSRFVFLKQYLLCYAFYVLLLTGLASGLTWLNKFSKSNFRVNALAFLVFFKTALVFVVPLFLAFEHKLLPLSDPELRREVDAMGKKLGLTSKNVHVVSANTAPSHGLALHWGFCKFKHAYLNESYVTLGKPSAMALLSHVFGHFKHHHFFKTFVFDLLKDSLFLFLFDHFKGDTALFKSFNTHSVPALTMKLDTFVAFVCPLYFLCNALKSVYFHYLEFEADRHAVRLGHSDELVNFWTTVYREKKWFFNVDPLYGKLFNFNPLFGAKHGGAPSLFERVYAVYDATVASKPVSN
uniref:Metallo-protease, putative n=1 Tax=Theileria annulata TaxID=5874 RepID=A0A3B0MLM8_THEAN